ILSLALAGTLYAQTENVETQPEALWQFTTGGSLWANPVTDGTTIWFGSDDHHFYALDAVTGEQRWKFATSGRVRGQAALGKQQLFFSSDDGHLYALDKASGTLRYQVILD